MAEYIKHHWGYELNWANNKLYSALIMIVLENQQTPYIYHKKRDKTLFILQGGVILVVEDKKKSLQAGESYHIPSGVMHRLIALKSDATILEVGTQLIDDAVLVEE